MPNLDQQVHASQATHLGQILRVGLQSLWLLVAVVVCDVAMAQSTAQAPRVGYVGWSPRAKAVLSPTVRGFLVGMQEHGYIEGRDYVFEYRASGGIAERFSDLTAELVRLPVDVLLVGVCGVPLSAARQATHTIPIVVPTCNDDMVELGIIKSMAHPGGNITGLSKLTPELAPKRLSLLKETIPSIKRVGVLWNPDYSAFTSDWRELREAAAHLGVTLVPFEFRRPDDFEAIFAAISRERPDALIMFSDPTVYSQAKRVAALASVTKIPTMFPFRELPDAGGLMSYGPNLAEMWRRSADYVVRILKGANPADMAIEQPSRLEFVINLKAARALGIMVPQSLLLRADEVIR